MFLTNIDNIIWDWNGTLLDDVSINWLVINLMLRKRKLKKLTYDEYRKIFCFPVENFYMKAGFDIEQNTISNLSKEYHTLYHAKFNRIKLNKETISALVKIKEKGVKQYIYCPHLNKNFYQCV